MKTTTMALAVLSILFHASASLAADAKSCKDGQVYNPQTGKCVTKRGS